MLSPDLPPKRQNVKEAEHHIFQTQPEKEKKKVLNFSLSLPTYHSQISILPPTPPPAPPPPPKYQQSIVITRTKQDGPGRKKTRNGTAAHPRLYRPRSRARPRPRVVPWPCPTGPPLFPPFACHFSSFAPAAAVLSSPAAARTTSARRRHHRRGQLPRGGHLLSLLPQRQQGGCCCPRPPTIPGRRGARRVCRTDPRRTRR